MKTELAEEASTGGAECPKNPVAGSAEFQKEKVLVIDNGSYRIKYGVPEIHEEPVSFRTISATTPEGNINIVGDAVMEREFQVKEPIVDGVIQDFDRVEQMWTNCLMNANGLYACRDEVSLFMTEGINNPKENREKTCEIVFESLKASQLYLTATAPLCLYASGRSKTMTGLVIECGYNSCRAVPIVNGTIVERGLKQLGIGGKNLVSNAATIMNIDELDARLIIESGLCKVSRDFASSVGFFGELYSGKAVYTLPNGDEISLTNERVRIPEPLFGNRGLHILCDEATTSSSADFEKMLKDNIILCGGSSCFEGLQERLEKEMKTRAEGGMECNIIQPDTADILPYIGACMIASNTGFASKWVTRKEYEEQGTSAIRRIGAKRQ